MPRVKCRHFKFLKGTTLQLIVILCNDNAVLMVRLGLLKKLTLLSLKKRSFEVLRPQTRLENILPPLKISSGFTRINIKTVS